MWIVQCASWIALFWALYTLGHNVKCDYDMRVRQQEENMWLYKHCSENAQLKEHTDACDRAALLFSESPLEGALLNPIIGFISKIWQQVFAWHGLAAAYVNEHHFLFLVVWLFLFLTLPRLLLGRNSMLLKQERLRGGAATYATEPPSRHKRRSVV